MQKKIVLIVFLFSSIAASAQVEFIMNDWKKVTEKAKSENKYIFLDAYTDWCSWCKVMDKKTFSDKQVGNFMNSKWIAAKMDMEKGFGIELSMKYGVSAFPTYLIFNSKGELLTRLVGYQEIEPFMKNMEEALAIQNPLAGYNTKMDIDYPKFYIAAYDGKKETPNPKSAEVCAYLDGQKDLYSEVNWNIIKRFTLNDKYNNYFLSNLETYRKLFGNEVDDVIDKVLASKLNKAIADKDDAELNSTIELVYKYHNADADEMASRFQSTYYLKTGNCPKYVEITNRIIEKNQSITAGELNQYGWSVYESCNGNNEIKTALTWMERAVTMDPDYAVLDTYAALLYKDKNYKEAKLYAEKAIEAGKESGEDTKETQALLEKINAELK